MSLLGRLRARVPSVKVEGFGGVGRASIGDVRIVMNSNAKMTRGKYAAQAVHAALLAAGVPHGRVIVLGGKPHEVEAMPTVIRDAGLTEVEPGTLTAGARIEN